MANIKYADLLGGMFWDTPAHTHTQNQWAQMKNARTWVKSIENVGGWVPEFTNPLGITQPTLMQFWQSLNSAGTQQGYYVYALAGNIRRISPAGDTSIIGLNPNWQPTLMVSMIVSATQLQGTGIGTAFAAGSFISSGASTTPVQVTGVIDANNITVVSTTQWQPKAVLQTATITSVNSATVLVGTGIGTGRQVGNLISATQTGTPVAITMVIDANTLQVTSTAQWGSVTAVTNPALYTWTTPGLANLFRWTMGNYVSSITGAALTTQSKWYLTTFSGGYNLVVGTPDIVPQYMNGDLAQLLPLPGFTYGSINNSQVIASTAKVVRAFGSQLIAGNFTHRLADGTLVQRPSTLRFSDNSAPGGIPQSWTPTATNAADEFELNTTYPIQDILVFRNYAVVLTTETAFLVTNATAGSPTTAKLINPIRGALGYGCAQVVDGYLYILTQDDIMRTDGTSAQWQSIANDVVKSYFFEDELNPDQTIRQNAFVRFHRYFNELFIAYPSKASTGPCDRALLFGIDDSAWSWTELPNIYDATLGPTVGAGDALRPWPANTYNFNISRLHFAGGNQLEALDIGYARPAPYGPYTMDLQKYFDFGDIQSLDASQVKDVVYVFPKFTSIDVTANTPAMSTITFYAKFFNSPIQAPPFLDWTTWDWTEQFTVGNSYTTDDYWVVPAARTRYMALRIISNSTNRINLTSIELQIKQYAVEEISLG